MVYSRACLNSMIRIILPVRVNSKLTIGRLDGPTSKINPMRAPLTKRNHLFFHFEKASKAARMIISLSIYIWID
jgi:hypothetical protein